MSKLDDILEDLIQEILEKAIQKAIVGGWKGANNWYWDNELTMEAHNYPKEFIYDHDFARALWGEDTRHVTGVMYPKDTYPLLWCHHLQQMVIADDPIKYLGENI